MKKVAVVLDEMSIGGIPKACAAFLKQLVQYCDVTMIMRNDQGELMSLLPENVSVKVIPRYVFRDAVKKLWSGHQFIRLISYAASYLWWSRICHRWVKANEATAKIIGSYVCGDYDCAIAYHGMSISHMVTALHNIGAKKKIAWIHGDHPFEGIHKKDAEKVYAEFDKIYCVSSVMQERFLNDFPSVEMITDSYKNILEPELIREKATAEDVDFDSNYFNIVTVGRVSPEKGQDLIPQITRNLLNRGYKIRWYVVGDGGDMERIRQLCTKLQVAENVILVGAKQNPYPYILSCDIYVQPSYTEGYCLTVCEAAILKKPIVLTVAAAAAGILVDGENSIVTDSDTKGLTNGIEKMITESDLQRKFSLRLSQMDLSNADEINKLIDFLNQT